MGHAPRIVLLSLVTASGVDQEKTLEPGLYEKVTKTGKGPADTTRICMDAKGMGMMIRWRSRRTLMRNR